MSARINSLKNIININAFIFFISRIEIQYKPDFERAEEWVFRGQRVVKGKRVYGWMVLPKNG